MDLKNKLKANAKVKAFVLWTITSPINPRPRLWIRLFVNPVLHKKGKGAKIKRWRSRIDVFPNNKFNVGKNSTIEDFCTVNNGVGDVIIGDRVRVGIGSVVLGPVTLGDGAGLGQHVFISGFNHDYSDGEKNSSDQGIVKRPTIIEEEVHIGANCVVVAGVTIGKRTQIGAGSVVTKNIPPFSIAVGNPARVIKRYNLETKQWEKV